MNKPLLTLALTLSCTAAGAASPPATLPASVAACLRVTDAGQRLACYDQSVAALLPAAAPPAPVAATTPAIKAPPPRPLRRLSQPPSQLLPSLPLHPLQRPLPRPPLPPRRLSVRSSSAANNGRQPTRPIRRCTPKSPLCAHPSLTLIASPWTTGRCGSNRNPGSVSASLPATRSPWARGLWAPIAYGVMPTAPRLGCASPASTNTTAIKKAAHP